MAAEEFANFDGIQKVVARVEGGALFIIGHPLGISIKTLRNWEKGRRKPQGSARILLQVADKHPEILLDVVHKS